MPRFFQITISKAMVRTLLLTLLALFLLALAGTFFAVDYLSRDLPSLGTLQTIEPSVKTIIFAANGDTLREFYSENRTIVPLSRIPVSLQEAVISIEDRRFYEHYGIDLRRLLGVVWINLTTSRSPGGSTLTQQLARNLFPKLLPSQKRITRKFREWIVAIQIESIYTKDEILAMYLNQIYLGKGTYGVQAAAHTFFGKDVWDLSPPETTMLAGMIQMPEHYSPFNHLEQAYSRRSTVLETMIKANHLSRAEAESIGIMEVHPVDGSGHGTSSGFAAYFVEEVRKLVEKDYGAEKLYKDGLRVWTTLVPQYQIWMEEALEAHLTQEEQDRDFPMKRAIYDSLTAIEERPAGMEYLQGAALLEDVRTGAILGMIGGRSFDDYKWNMSTQASRQPGSIFKPIVYLTALQHGYQASSILMDTPFVLDTGVSLWRPKNFSGRFRGPMTLRYALSRSVNTPTAKLFNDFGLNPLLDNVRKLGFTTNLPRVPSLFLGAGEVTLREVVAAYSTFANHGVYVRQHLITRVESADGEILEEFRIQQREALDPAEAYMLTNLLNTTLVEGTGRSARWRGFTKTGAGKTGTTNENTNAWFCGFTPSFCGGVWVGFDRATPMGKGATGSHMALPIWTGFMGKIADKKGEEPFIRPPGILEKTICLETGMLATSGCDSVTVEVFLPNCYPQTICDVHGGQLHDFQGVDKDFKTLDSNEDEF
ncbi:MAG: PBP1A family penicillin-binding protein [Gemmatimonadales bacterium]|nr:PBP1A family penicillin-binding protein [Gemmatimonadales bacterium]